MRRAEHVPADSLTVPADVFHPQPGENLWDWSERFKQWFRDRDYCRGRTVFAPDGSVFFEPVSEDARAILPVFDRTHAVRQWKRSHPGR